MVVLGACGGNETSVNPVWVAVVVRGSGIGGLVCTVVVDDI